MINPALILICPLFRLDGGIRIRKKAAKVDKIGKHGRTVEAHVVTTIQDMNERRDGEAITRRALDIVRKYSVHTLLGYLVDQGTLAAMNTELTEVRAEGDGFNLGARTCQAYITYLPITLAGAISPDVTRAIVDHIRGELTALRDALAQRDTTRARMIRNTRCRRLGALVSGAYVGEIQRGLDSARDVEAVLRRLVEPEERGGQAEFVRWGLAEMDQVLEVFTYPVAGGRVVG